MHSSCPQEASMREQKSQPSYHSEPSLCVCCKGEMLYQALLVGEAVHHGTPLHAQGTSHSSLLRRGVCRFEMRIRLRNTILFVPLNGLAYTALKQCGGSPVKVLFGLRWIKQNSKRIIRIAWTDFYVFWQGDVERLQRGIKQFFDGIV